MTHKAFPSSFFMLFIFICFLCISLSCHKKTTNTQPKQNLADIPIIETDDQEDKKIEDSPSYSIVKADLVDQTHTQYVSYTIPDTDLNTIPVKSWQPVWQYTCQNKGYPIVTNLSIDDQAYLLINNPLVHIDAYYGFTQPETFYDDIVALKPEAKQKLWQYRINSICGRNMLIQDDCIFIGTSQGPMGLDDDFFMFCLNKQIGQELWRCPINGITETNIVFLDNRVYFGVSGYDGNFIYCVDALTGQVIYQCLAPKNVDFDYTIEFISIENLLYFSDPKTSCIYSFKPDTQQYNMIYQNKLITIGELAYSIPYLLFEGTDKGSLSSLYAFNLSNNQIDWMISFRNKDYNYLRKPIVKENLVYFDSYGFIACIDIKTKQLLWSFADPVHDIQEFILDSNRVLIGIEEEPYEARDTEQYYRRYILSLDANTGKANWKMQKGARLSCLYQDKILLTDENNMYMIEENR